MEDVTSIETEAKEFGELIKKMLEHPVIQLSEVSKKELTSLSLLYTIAEIMNEDGDKDLLVFANYLMLLRHALYRKREKVLTRILSTFRWRVSNIQNFATLKEKLIPFGKEGEESDIE